MRTSGLSRYTTLLVAVALAIGFLPIAGVQPAEAGPPDTEWIAVHYDSAPPGEFYGRVTAYNWPDGIPLTLAVERASLVVFTEVGTAGEEYPFDQILQDESRFAVEPGDVVTVTDGTVTRELAVMELTLDAIGFADDIVYGTSSDLSEVCVSVWSADPYVTLCTSPETDGSWLVSFPATPDIIQKDLDVAAWQYDTDGDAVTMNNHRVAFPSFAVYPYQGSSNYVWGVQWSGPVDLYVDDDYDLGNGVLFESLDIPVDESGWFGAQQQFDSFQIERGQIVTVTDSINTKVHQVSNAWIISFDFEHDTISGRAAPGSNVEVLVGPPGNERSIGRNVTTDGTGQWIADFSLPSGNEPMDVTFDVAPGTDATANQTDDDNDMTGIDVIAPAQVHRQIEVYPGLDMVGVWWETASVFSLTIERDGVVVYSKTNHPGAFDVGSDGFDLMAGDRVFVSDNEITKDHLVTDQVITSVDPGTDIVTGTATDGTDLYLQFYSVFGGDESGGGMAGPVVHDGFGTWSLDLTGSHDVQAGSVIEASYFDPPNGDIEDNDQTKAVEWLPLPTITAHPSDLVVGEGWPVDVPVAISIDGFTVDPSPVPERRGIFPWETHFETGLYNETAQTEWALQAGNVVTASGGIFTKIHEVVAVGFDELNVEDDFGAGTAPTGTIVKVSVRNGEEPLYSSSALAGLNGAWLVDFGAEGFDITAETGGLARVSDDDYDATVVGIGPEGGGGDEPGPTISVNPDDDSVWGQSWTEGVPVTITVDDPGTPVTPDFTYPTPLPVNNWGENLWDAGFGTEGPFGFDIQDGHLVTVTDGTNTKTHTVTNLRAIAVEASTNVVSGSAGADTDVQVALWGTDTDPHVQYTATADSSGYWDWDFTSDRDITADTSGAAWQSDEDGDQTQIAFGPVGGGEGGDPSFVVAVVWDAVEGHHWPDGAWVTLTIDDPLNGPGVDYSDARPVGDNDVGSDGNVGFPLDGFDVQPGHFVTLTDGGDIIQHHVVRDHQVTGADVDLNTVTGTAEPGTDIWIFAEREDGYRAQRLVSADESGDWIAYFAEGPDPGMGDGTIDIRAGIWGGALQGDPENGNETEYHWWVADPHLIAEVYGAERINGEGLPPVGYTIEIDNDEECPHVVESGGPEFEIDAGELCDDGNLEPGHHVVVTADRGGELIAEFTIDAVVISGADPATDSIWGLGTSGKPVTVAIFDEFGEPSVMRTVDPGADGAWIASLNDTPTGDLETNFGQSEIDDQAVWAAQFDLQGRTESNWSQAEPHLSVNPIHNYVAIEGWPTGPAAPPIMLELYETGDAGAALLHSELIDASGLFYMVRAYSGLGGVDIVAGHHLVATGGAITRTHTVTELTITSFDFPNNSFEGTATADPSNSVTAGAWNETGDGSVEGLVGSPWTADFTGQVEFGEWIGGFVAEMDPTGNATFFDFEAEYEELNVPGGETSVTTNDGRITIDGLGEGDSINVIEQAPTGGGYEWLGNEYDLDWDGDLREPGNPLILTLRVSGDEMPPGLDVGDIVVFRDHFEVPECEPPLDTYADYPCISLRLQHPNGDIEITVQTLSFSVWTMGFTPQASGFVLSAPVEPVQIGTEITATVEFFDSNAAPVHGFEWNWGDGITSSSENPTATHIYTEPGVYTIGVTPFGLGDTAVFEYVVVYDPEGGFVTGGGWIYSPAGAYTPDLDLEGKATFGFVSKYKKGASIPTGNTEFQFHAGDLNFNSTSYDWLVITGSDYARYKGVGTINGEGEYKFMIWAGDEDPDTFRIKIWAEDELGEESVVYDNDNGTDQVINAGSIIVHSQRK